MKVSFKAFVQGNYYLLKRGAGGKVILVTILAFIIFAIVSVRSCMTSPLGSEIEESLVEMEKAEIHNSTIDLLEIGEVALVNAYANGVDVEKVADTAVKVAEIADSAGLNLSALQEVPTYKVTYKDDAVDSYCKEFKLIRFVKQKENNVADAIIINYYLTKVFVIIVSMILVYRILLFFIANFLVDKSLTFEEIKMKKPVFSYIFSFIIPLIGPGIVFLILILLRIPFFG